MFSISVILKILLYLRLEKEEKKKLVGKAHQGKHQKRGRKSKNIEILDFQSKNILVFSFLSRFCVFLLCC